MFIHDQMQMDMLGRFLVDVLEKSQRLLKTVLTLDASNQFALEIIQRCKQRDRAVASVIMGFCLDMTDPQRQPRLYAFQGLHLTLEANGLQPMGVKEGIQFSKILHKNHKSTWNKAAGGKSIALETDGSVVTYTLDGGMKITVLGPTHGQLTKLCERWDKVVEECGADENADTAGEDPPGLELEVLGLVPMGPIDVPTLAESRFVEDKTIPNGSSIELVLEFGERRALMLGDAYPSVVTDSLRKLSPDGCFKADVVKVAHHGSRNNTDLALTSLLSVPTWIYSSNGANNTKHPHLESIARVLHSNSGKGEKTIIFNYRTDFNDVWDDEDLMKEFGYKVHYGNGQLPVLLRQL